MARRYDPAAARDFLEPWLVRDEGAETRAFCPLDEEPGASSSPSASFNFDDNLWHCKKSDHGGSIANLVADLKQAGAGTRTIRRVGGVTRQAEPEPSPFPYTDDEVEEWHERLMADDEQLEVLASARGLEPATLAEHMIGWDGERFTIPVWDREGLLVNIRRYRPGATSYKMLNVPGHGEHRIYGLDVLEAETDILWTAGEMDRLFASQEGWHAVTHTAGEKYFDRAWGQLFAGKNVWVAYDADDTGRSGANKAIDIIREHAAKVYRVDVPEVRKGYDVTDVLLDDGPEGLARLVAAAVDLSKQPPTPVRQDGRKVSLQETMGEDVQSLALEVVVSVAGKQAEPYTAPRAIEAHCDMNKGTVCDICPVKEFFNGHLEMELRQDNADVYRFVDTTEVRRQALLKEVTGAKCSDRVTFSVGSNWHIEELLVQPSIDERSDSEDMKPIKRTAFSVGTHRTQTNQKVRLVGSNVVDPKTGKLRFMSWVNEAVELDIDRFELTPELREVLKAFQPTDQQTPLEKCLEIARDMSDNVTHIYGRDVAHVGYDLVWHSVLTFDAYRSRVTKGWLEAMAVGDTRTGKSEIASRLIAHYRSGQLLSCEGATFAGLVGGVQQIDGRWHMTWGAVPMNDRRLVVLDEASGISERNVIEQMSSIRSSGVAQITKISSEETSARTRLLWITNPADGSMLSQNVDVGMAALRSVVPNNEDIARFDFVMALARGEVDQHVINSAEAPTYAPRYSAAMCEALVKWAWSLSGDQVRISRAAEHRAADLAIELGDTYVADPPLVQSENVRFKLLRLACALAARTFSIGEDATLRVEAVHVDDAARFLQMIYGADSMGYLRKSRRTRMMQAKADTAAASTKRFIQATPSLLTTLLAVGSTTFRMRDFSEFSGTAGLSPMAVEEHVGQLISDGMIQRRDRGAMAMSPTLIRILKELEDEQME